MKGTLHKDKQRQVVDPRADRNPSWLNTRLGSSRTGETLLQGGFEESIEREKAQWVRPNGWGKRMAKEGVEGSRSLQRTEGAPGGEKGGGLWAGRQNQGMGFK